MAAFSNALLFICKALGVLLGVLVVGGIALISCLAWSQQNTNDVYSECQMRAIENKVGNDLRNLHTDYCMLSHGYRRTGCGLELTVLPSCYLPRWRNW